MARRCCEGLPAARTRPIWDHKTLKSDRGLNLGPRMTFNINKPIKNLVFLKVRLTKLIEIFVFLKVQTRNCVRGRSFQITKRSTSIGVSISSKFVRSAGSRQIPSTPIRMMQNGQLATTPTRAWSKDDGSSKQTPSNYMAMSIWLCMQSLSEESTTEHSR